MIIATVDNILSVKTVNNENSDLHLVNRFPLGYQIMLLLYTILIFVFHSCLVSWAGCASSSSLIAQDGLSLPW